MAKFILLHLVECTHDLCFRRTLQSLCSPRMDLFAWRCEHVLILEVKFICVLLHYTSTQGGETRNAFNSEQTQEAHPTSTRHTLPCVGRLCVSDPTPSHPILRLALYSRTSKEVFNWIRRTYFRQVHAQNDLEREIHGRIFKSYGLTYCKSRGITICDIIQRSLVCLLKHSHQGPTQLLGALKSLHRGVLSVMLLCN